MNTIKTAIIGFGKMGRLYLKEFQKSPRYEVAYICDLEDECLALAAEQEPGARLTKSFEEVLADPEVQVVVLSALAGGRHERIRLALEAGKHIIAEKPLADTVEHEMLTLEAEKQHPELFCTVDLYLRNSWYHSLMLDFINEGEIGDLGIVRICHMTPGLAPGEGHEDEGPCFHDCGMHYADLARLYSGSDFKTCHAQGIRMWDYKDPWWLQCHGTMENGVVYDITQGFVYGQLSKDQVSNCYVEAIGSKGLCRFRHDFKTAVLELHGVSRTERIERPCGGKHIDVMIDRMADSIETGRRHPGLPRLSDSVIASAFTWRALDLAREADLPSIGTEEELIAIRDRRANMEPGQGYGLIPRIRAKKP